MSVSRTLLFFFVFLYDSLCTTLCLQWEPEIVAIALMHLAGKLSKFEVVDWVGRNSEHYRWWDMFVDDMTIELLEDICHQVLDLYSQTQGHSQTDSPPPVTRMMTNNSSNSNSAAGPPGVPPLPPQQSNSTPTTGIAPPIPAGIFICINNKNS